MMHRKSKLKDQLSKIMIFGLPGSGKSTFALHLHKLTKIPLHHLDKHFYKSNWIERDYQEFLSIQQSIVESDSWIIDGNSIKSLEMRYKEADVVLYFNYPRWVCYLRIFKRLFNKNTDISDRAEECKETIQFKLLRYTWNFNDRITKQIAFFKNKYPHVRFVEITSDKDLQKLKHELMKGYLA